MSWPRYDLCVPQRGLHLLGMICICSFLFSFTDKFISVDFLLKPKFLILQIPYLVVHFYWSTAELQPVLDSAFFCVSPSAGCVLAALDLQPVLLSYRTFASHLQALNFVFKNRRLFVLL